MGGSQCWESFSLSDTDSWLLALIQENCPPPQLPCCLRVTPQQPTAALTPSGPLPSPAPAQALPLLLPQQGQHTMGAPCLQAEEGVTPDREITPLIKMPFTVWGLSEGPRVWKHITESSPVLAGAHTCVMWAGLELTLRHQAVGMHTCTHMQAHHTYAHMHTYHSSTWERHLTHSQVCRVDVLCVPPGLAPPLGS